MYSLIHSFCNSFGLQDKELELRAGRRMQCIQTTKFNFILQTMYAKQQWVLYTLRLRSCIGRSI